MKKTKAIHIRVTEAELQHLKKRSAKYKNMSAYIIDATNNFDDSLTIGRIDLINKWADDLVQYKSELAHLGSNVNQLAHYLNSQIQLGVLTSNAITKEMDLLESLRSLLLSLDDNNKRIISEFKKLMIKK